MFRGVGRKLAILNALVVIAVIALAGGVIYLVLLRSLNAEVDRSLSARIGEINDVAVGGANGVPPSDGERDGTADPGDRQVLQSGDTILIAVNPDHKVMYNPRGIILSGVPVSAGIDRALTGQSDARSVDIAGIGRMRVVSAPLRHDGTVIGAAQALQSLDQHEAELATVRWVTLLGIGLGALIAVPVGLFLASRAMRPIDEAFVRQRTFVADASHEFRTPLTLIRANAEMAGHDPRAPVASIQGELGSILEEVDRSDRLVEDLLTLARADAGRLTLDREPLEVAALVSDAVRTMRPLALERGIDLAARLSDRCEAMVDPERLRQVVRILIDNALKHTPQGGEITVTVGRRGRDAMVSVSDTGAGIHKHDLPHIFDRFYRSDRARTRKTGGTGLGLPIAKALVEAHGGKIAVSSEPDRGTTVTFTVPALVHSRQAAGTREERALS
ncbi:MAG TPA: ATP-binding protein [Thermomicrobiaceae bacterium]|nr:ATP-binding protein [Thermomicrobiaceae bacterium]